jgi:hypothetical protein
MMMTLEHKFVKCVCRGDNFDSATVCADQMVQSGWVLASIQPVLFEAG